jgi:hypothetical protein
MSTAGIFTLISNDGKQDRLLMATAFLNQRLAQIEKARALDPTVSDSTPTLADIEKTHVLFMNAHFKPFAAIGFEYNKVRAGAGNPTLGGSVQFSLPQFGDFFHDMVVHMVLRQPTLTATASADSDKPLMRWCPFIGERALRRTQMLVNGNPLDDYANYTYNFYRETCVAPGKRTSWDRCVGQEVPEAGFVDQPTWARSGVAPSAITSRSLWQTVSGAQTPTGQKDTSAAGDLELFIPLLFWFNKDARLSVPSVSIPYGQRFVEIDLAEQTELVNIVPRGASTWASPGGSIDTSVNILRTIELYINNIFLPLADGSTGDKKVI